MKCEHEWSTSPQWGVVAGVGKCVKCGTDAKACDSCRQAVDTLYEVGGCAANPKERICRRCNEKRAMAWERDEIADWLEKEVKQFELAGFQAEATFIANLAYELRQREPIEPESE